MLGLIPLKDWVYLGLIVALISFGFYERQHLINEGENRCLVRERAAAEKQAVEDANIAKDTIDGLNSEISRLHDTIAPADPGVVTRVQCYARKMPAAGSVTGTAQPAESAAAGRGIQPLPQGSGSGLDLGPSLQRLALAADLVSARDRACLKELREP